MVQREKRLEVLKALGVAQLELGGRRPGQESVTALREGAGLSATCPPMTKAICCTEKQKGRRKGLEFRLKKKKRTDERSNYVLCI